MGSLVPGAGSFRPRLGQSSATLLTGPVFRGSLLSGRTLEPVSRTSLCYIESKQSIGHTYKRDGCGVSVVRKCILWDQIDLTWQYNPKGLKFFSFKFSGGKRYGCFRFKLFLLSFTGLFSSAFLFNSLPWCRRELQMCPLSPGALHPHPHPHPGLGIQLQTEDDFHLADSGSSSFQAEAESFLGWNFPVLNPANPEQNIL